MIFGGIDPGKDGALVWMPADRSRLEIRDVPLLHKQKRRPYDFFGMVELAREMLLAAGASSRLVVSIEQVHSMPSDGVVAAFSFGLGYGGWLTALASVGVRPTLLDPAAWKRSMLAGLAAGKESSTKQASRLFPAYADAFVGKRGGLLHGRAEAALMCELGRRRHLLSGGGTEMRRP